MAFACPVLLLLQTVCLAQPNITAQPNPFDPAKSKSVILRIEGTETDLQMIKDVQSVTVGGNRVSFQPDETNGTITITDPPADLTGQQTVNLLGSTGNALGHHRTSRRARRRLWMWRRARRNNLI